MSSEEHRRLDAAVAEHVMGLQPPEGFRPFRSEYVKDCEQVDVESRSITTWRETWPAPYSSDIAAAWQVVEKMAALHSDMGEAYALTIQNCCRPAYQWCCIIAEKNVSDGRADTAPLAICLAALRAVGYDTGSWEGGGSA